MDFSRRLQLITDIIAGYTVLNINNQKYIIQSPSIDLCCEAECLYQSTLYDNRFELWLTRYEAKEYLKKKNILIEDLKDIDRKIENLKVDLFNSRLKLQEATRIRKSLKSTKHHYNKIQNIQNSLDEYTIEGYAEIIKHQYLIIHTIYCNNKKTWSVVDDVEYHFLQKVISGLVNMQPSIEILRELARTDPWTGYWRINNNPFDKAPIYLNDVQRSLLLFSQMYANAYEQSDYPGDGLENDDDMFDGWMIMTRRKIEKERNTQQIDKTIGDKHHGAQELFVPVDNAKAARKVNEMNTIQGKMVKKQREAFLKKRKKVAEGELPDKQLERRMQATQQYVQSVKDRAHG